MVMVAAAVVVMSGCASSSVPPGASTPTGNASQPAASSVASTEASAASGTTAVDLVFTGSKPFVAKGSAGRCIIVPRSDGTVSFGFEATEADYPGLGQSYSMANLSGDYVDIKWAIDGQAAYNRPSQGGSVILSADHHSVQIDTDLAPAGPAGAPRPGPEHVSGTISCP